MHDIRSIREDPQAFDRALARRGMPPRADALLHIDAALRAAKGKTEALLAERKRASAAVQQARIAGDTADAKQWVDASIRVAQQLPEAERVTELETRTLNDALAAIPNLPDPDVPDGSDEGDNVVVGEIGARASFDFAVREHFDFGPALGLDFVSAQAVAGARFAYLHGAMARLNRALGQFMLDVHTTEFGYVEIVPPLLVRDEAMFGTGQLPKFADDSFRTSDNRWLIPTSEVSLTNLVRDRILNEGELPLRFAALTPCFRSEAGAAGRDTRGLIRQHQFDKVELVSITTPDASDAEHERMTQAAETILDRLGLPYRRVLLCAGDMGFSARKTYDLEVWLPGQDRYREVSSCSTCGDFQARRMNARYKAGPKDNRFVHTLNGSGVAVGRALVAVLENYQQADGSVIVPDVLLPFMGGLTRLMP